MSLTKYPAEIKVNVAGSMADALWPHWISAAARSAGSDS
jgi:hypothetical protein